jgi:hypothetical protein
MNALHRISAALISAMCIAGCMTPGAPMSPSAVVTSQRLNAIPGNRMGAVVIGKSTKADVRAALGDTLTIGFDNGYEVWVYRLDRNTTAEFVILFPPSGIVAKTRIRPDPQRS